MEASLTERLLLRPLRLSDAEACFRIYQNPDVLRFMGSGPASIDDERQHIARQIEDHYPSGTGLQALVLRDSGELIGHCGLLFQQVQGVRELEITYLVAREHWGKNLGSEAAFCAVSQWRHHRSEARLVAIVHPDNLASVRVAQKAGFTRFGPVSFKHFGRVDLYTQNRN